MKLVFGGAADSAFRQVRADATSLDDALATVLATDHQAFTATWRAGTHDRRSAVSEMLLNLVLTHIPGATVLPSAAHRITTVIVEPPLGPTWVVAAPAPDRIYICCWPALDRLLLLTVDDAGTHPLPASRWAAIDYRYPDGGVRFHRAGLVEPGLWFELHRYTDSMTVRLAPVDATSRTATRLMDGFLREVADHDSAGILMGLAALGVPCDGSLTASDLVALADLDETFESMVALEITPPAEFVADLVALAAGQLGGGLGAVIRSVQRVGSSRPS